MGPFFLVVKMEDTIITSVQNERVKFFSTLNTVKGRKQEGLLLLDGEKLIEEACSANIEILYSIVEEGKQQTYQQLLNQKMFRNTEMIQVAPHVMGRISSHTTPQGIVAVIRMPEQQQVQEGFKGDVVVLDGVADPGNVGTILRTAFAFGCKSALLLKESADPFSPRALRAGMGAQLHLNVIVENAETALQELKLQNYTLIGTDIAGKETLRIPKEKRACIIGSEAHGMQESVKALCDVLYRIPMRGDFNSLNAAVAAGVAMFNILNECV